MRVPTDIKAHPRSTAPLICSIPRVDSVRNSNKISDVEPKSFMSRSKAVDTSATDAGRYKLPS